MLGMYLSINPLVLCMDLFDPPASTLVKSALTQGQEKRCGQLYGRKSRKSGFQYIGSPWNIIQSHS